MQTSISNGDALKLYDELKTTFTTTDIARAILKLSGLEEFVWQAQLDEARAKLSRLVERRRKDKKPLMVVKMQFVQMMFLSLFVIPIRVYLNQKPEVGKRHFSIAR